MTAMYQKDTRYRDETAQQRYQRLSQLKSTASRNNWRQRFAHFGGLLVIAATLLMVLVPVLFTLSTSLKPRSEIAQGLFWPEAASLDNWSAAFGSLPLVDFISNSVLCAVLSATLTLIITTPATYAMAKLGVGKKFLPDFTVATFVAPPIVALLPLFIMLQKLSLTNSVWGLTLVYGLMNIPVAFWLMRGFVSDIPRSIDEAAWLDGAGYWRTFMSINLPLLVPGFIATGLICAILSFNEFLFASAMTFGPESRTLTVGISLFQGERFVNFGQMAAASLSGMIPVYFLAIVVQKWLIGGLAQGSIK